MKKVTIYHNPRCSKSRTVLQQLEQNHEVKLEIRDYLKEPLDQAEAENLVFMLKEDPNSIIREKDTKKEGIQIPSSPEQVVQLLLSRPKLLERPIVVIEKIAVIARPVERVDTILNR